MTAIDVLRQDFVAHFVEAGGGDPVWYEFIFRMAEILSAKNTDYSKGSNDKVENPYSCFEGTAVFAETTVVQGILIRKGDKLERCKTLRHHDPQVTSEGLLRTLLDEANYAIIEMGWHLREALNNGGRHLSTEQLCAFARETMVRAEALQTVFGPKHPEKDDGRPVLGQERPDQSPA